MREEIAPTPAISHEIVTVDGRPVVVIKVDELAKKPCAKMDSNRTFIRRGATNRHPSPAELAAFYGAEADAYVPWKLRRGW